MPPPVQSHPTTTTVDEGHVLLKSFNSFLTVAIHNILFYRNIYPPETFLTTRVFNLPVHQNRHPKVCSWINDAITAVAAQIANGNVSRIAVVIHSPLHTIYPLIPSPSGSTPLSSSQQQEDYATTTPTFQVPATSSPLSNIPPGSVLERWLFDVSRFPAWPGGAKPMENFERVLANEAKREDSRDRPGSAFIHAKGGNVKWPDVDEQLRGALRRMTYTAEGMSRLPDGCTFTVAVELKEEGVAPIGYPQPWIPSEPNLQPPSRHRSGPGRDLGGTKTVPIRSVEAGPLYFECWVEEGKAKEALVSMQSSTGTADPP